MKLPEFKYAANQPIAAWDRKKHWGKDNLNLAKSRRIDAVLLFFSSFVLVTAMVILICLNADTVDKYGTIAGEAVISIPVWAWSIFTLASVAGILIVRSARK